MREFSTEHRRKIVEAKTGMKYNLKQINSAWIKKGERISSKTEFKKGQAPWNKGLHYLLKDGFTYDARGYKRYASGEHKGRGVHTVMAEKVLGRRLKRNECVHHNNGIKDDNRNRNFLICSASYHRWLEAKIAFIAKQILFGGV